MCEPKRRKIKIEGEGYQNPDGTITDLKVDVTNGSASSQDVNVGIVMTVPNPYETVQAVRADGNPLQVEASRAQWLLALGDKAAVKKVQIRLSTIRKQAIMLKIMEENCAWNPWCQNEFLAWFKVPVDGRAKTSSALLSLPPVFSEPQLALQAVPSEPQLAQPPIPAKPDSDNVDDAGGNDDTGAVDGAHEDKDSSDDDDDSTESDGDEGSDDDEAEKEEEAAKPILVNELGWTGRWEDVANSLALAARGVTWAHPEAATKWNEAIRQLETLQKM